MRGGRPGLALEPLRTLFGSGTFAGATDAQLLERFNGRRDDDAEAAFAALVSRHGPMVKRVCRSLLADPHDAEDAFQATFLVLARKAGTIRRPELLGNWLYGTAHRTARTLKTRAARRLKHESREAAMSLTRGSTDPEGIPDQALRREEAAIIHEEVARLPEACRMAVVLCELEGRSQEEIARLLHCSDRTLRRRLDRARDLLRARLTRRGLAPTVGLLAAALGPEPASAAISQATAQGLARAAIRFAAERATAGSVPASAATLAEGVISLMFWTNLKAIAIASGVLLAIGVAAGMGIGRGFAAQDGGKREPTRPPSGEASEVKLPSPAEQFRALVKEFDDAMAAYNKLGENVKTHEELQAIYKDRTLPEIAFNPRFLALAERYPNDPVAADALVLVLEKTMRYWDGYHRAPGDALGRTMEILGRDHLGDARLGSLMLKMVHYPSPRRDEFLRTVAERSTERVVHGQAILALAQYLKMKGEFVESLKKPSGAKEEKSLLDMYGADYLGQLRAADPAPLLREADQLFARVSNDYGDILYTPQHGQPTRETLADVAHRERRPGPVTNPSEQFRTMEESFNFAVKAANQAEEAERKKAGKAEPGEASLRAYIAAYPKWPDVGPKMWRLAPG